MTPNTNVRVWWDASVVAYRMSSPYNQELVESIKGFIPVSDRSYDPRTKIWTFVERQLIPLQGMFKMLNIYANVITRQQMETQSQTTQNTPASAQRVTPIDTVLVQFVRLLPYDAARTAYRKAQLTLHPDAGGDSNKASALNVAWQRIEKEIYGQ